MGHKYCLSAYNPTILTRFNYYTGDSIWRVIKEYVRRRREGKQHFVLTWWI